MTNQLILVEHGENPEIIAKLYPNAKWIYLSKDYNRRLIWERSLSVSLKIKYKVLLTELTYSMRDDFVNFLSDLGKEHWQRWEWWITPLANRSMACSSLYLYICYLEVLKQTLNPNETFIVIFESYDLLNTVASHFSTEFEIVRPFPKRKGFKFIQLIHDAIQYCSVWYTFLKKSQHELKWFKKTLKNYSNKNFFDANHVVIQTYINEKSINQDGLYNDILFPGLQDYLLNRGFAVSTIVWLYSASNKELLVEQLLKSCQTFIFPEFFYRLSDYLKSIYSLWKGSLLKIDKKKSIFKELNVHSLLMMEQKQHRYNNDIITFVNLRTLIKKLKINKALIKYFLTIWEHKYFENPAFYALNIHFPECTKLSYQQGVFIPQTIFANYKVNSEEFKHYPHADFGITSSPINTKALELDGFPQEFLKEGVALRYLYLKNYQLNRNETKQGILVCPPLMANTASELLYQCSKVLKDLTIPIYVKLHPGLKWDALNQDIVNNLPRNFKLVEGNMKEWLFKAKILITSESSAMIESVYNNIPTIVYLKETDIDILDIDCIPFKELNESNIFKFVIDGTQLLEAVNFFLNGQITGKSIETDNFFNFDMKLFDSIFILD